MKRWGMAALLVLATVSAPTAVRAEDGWLTVSGSTTAYVDIDLARSTTFNTWTIESKGRYAGFYIVPHDTTKRAGGAVRVRDFAAPSGTAPDIGIGVPTYEPGRVRVYLVADGPTTVRLHAGDFSEKRHLRPTRRVAASARVARLAPGVTTAGRIPVTTTKPSVAMTALMVTGDLASANEADLCLTTPRAGCPPHEGTFPWIPQNVERSQGMVSSTVMWSWAYPRHPAGRYAAVQTATSRTRIDRALATVFTLQLV